MLREPMNTVSKTSQPSSTLILGLGRTGYSVVGHLANRNEKVTVADSRSLPPYLAKVRAQYPNVEVFTGGLPMDSLAQFDRIVVSPGVAVDSAISNAHNLIGDIDLFVESAHAPIIAITGSNGKSTVTTLVADMLKAAGKTALAGGNIGTPTLDLLTQSPPDFYVLELSSFQLEHTHHLAANIATILNISADHMDRYTDIDAYIAAKARILDGATIRVFNRNDHISSMLMENNPNTISFGIDHPTHARDYGLVASGQDRFICRGTTRLASVDQITMQGEQNITNILAALALVDAAQVDITSPIINAALTHSGLEHRCEWVASINGVKWINDSKGTNVGSTVAAIHGFTSQISNNLILIAGGLGKGADFLPLKQAASGRVAHAVLFGQDADRLQDALATVTETSLAHDLSHAVSLAAAHAKTGQTVLFSPACASFDMFENYEQRGYLFKRLVVKLNTCRSPQ